MNSRSDRRLAVVGRAGSLMSLAHRLRTRGWDVIRVTSIHSEPVRIPRPPGWLHKRPVADVWVVTSRAVVDTFLSTHPAWMPFLRSVPDVVAVGADTARALRTAGIRRIRTALRGGSQNLLAMLGPIRGRRVLYLRSDRAGPDIARELRRRGGRVVERVIYRVREARPVNAIERRRLSTIPVWIVSSPSALDGFRRMIGEDAFRARSPQVRSFALGERTASALRRAGVRRVTVSQRSTEEGFTKLLEQALGNAPGYSDRRTAR